MAETASICEVGPRDGLQMARSIMPTAVKSRWIEALVAAGVREIEVGSFVPPKLIPQMADTGAVVRAAATVPGLTVVALAPNLRGALLAAEAGAHRVTVPISVSEGHSRANTNKGTFEQVAEVGRMVAALRGREGPAIPLEATCATAFGCSIDGTTDPGRVAEVAAALVEAGADTISLADTVGYGDPGLVRAVLRRVRGAVGERLVRLHLHDTMGLGLANAAAGLEEGIRRFDSALAGLGGCPFAPGASGNVVTEDLAFLLESMGFSTGLDIARLVEARALIAEGLPGEAMHGQLARAGIPRTFRAAA